MGTRRFLMPLLAVAALATAAGCGGQTGTSGTMGDSADAVPAGALAYVDVNTDRESDAWKTLTSLGEKFPAYADASAGLQKELSASSGKCGTSLSDVEGAIGGDAGAAITSVDASGGGSPNWIVYVASNDDGKLQDAVESCKGTAKAGSYGGFTQYTDGADGHLAIGDHVMLVANSQDGLHESIDLLAGNGDSLADDPGFATAANGFPEDSLVNGYVDTQRVARLMSLAALAGAPQADAAQLRQSLKWLASVKSATFSVTPSDSGIHLSSSMTAASAADLPGPHAGGLTDRLPADTFAFLSASDLGDNLGPLAAAAETPVGVAPRQNRATAHLLRDVVELTNGGLLFYARPGLPVSAALLLRPADADRGLVTIGRLVRQLAQGNGAKVHGNSLRLAPGMDVTWKKVGDVIAVSNDPQAGSAPDQTLADSQSYQDFLQAAGAPSDAAVVLYVDTPGILSMAPAAADPNLKHIGGIAAWTTTQGTTVTTELFVQVR
jgi:hypothetical protein